VTEIFNRSDDDQTCAVRLILFQTVAKTVPRAAEFAGFVGNFGTTKALGTARRSIELKKGETSSRKEWPADDENESSFGFGAGWSGGPRKETHENRQKKGQAACDVGGESGTGREAADEICRKPVSGASSLRLSARAVTSTLKKSLMTGLGPPMRNARIRRFASG
jgi:hypothetical protein